MKKELKNIGILIGGNLMLAFMAAAFIIPHNIIMGGATGIGIILGKYFAMDTAAIVLIFNILMLILGAVVFGKKFLLTTIASSLLYPFFLAIMQRIPGIAEITDNTLTAALSSGALLGIALGLVMGIGSSTGGGDVLNLVIHKWFHLPLSLSVYITDAFILLGQALSADAEHILYGLIVIGVESFVLNQVLLTGQSQLQIIVVTDKYDEMRWKLLTELEAGVTMMCIETGYTCKKQKGILCVIPKRKLFAATQLIQNLDSNAFITVTQIKEVRGQGFTKARKPAEHACIRSNFS